MEVPYNQTYTVTPDYEHTEGATPLPTLIWPFTSDIPTWPGPFPIYHQFDIRFIIYWLVFFTALPGICFALYKMIYDQVVPVYVINLFISDLIQISANPIQITLWQEIGVDGTYIPWLIYLYGLQVNVFFMMCISAERYLMINHVFLYRKIQSHRTSVIVSVGVWILSAVVWMISYFSYFMAFVLLVPYPLTVFFFLSTWRALSRSSVPRNDQIRIRSILALLLCIYTVLFLPLIIMLVYPEFDDTRGVYVMAEILVAFNPLFDILLYVFLRRDVTHGLVALLCCKKRPEENSVSV